MSGPNQNHVHIRPDYRLQGFILIGGASRRMGSDKAQLELGGRTFIERIAASLSSIAETVRSVGSREDSKSGLINVPDVHSCWGALGGLHAALTACNTPWAAVVACDLPFVTSELFLRLTALRENFDAVVPVQSDGRPQPLCALYRCEVCLPQAAKLIDKGERRPRALLAAVNTRWVAPNELDDLAGAENFFSNINTPDDYRRAQLLVSGQQLNN